MCNDFLWWVDILDQLGDFPSAYQNLLESPLTNQAIEHAEYRVLIRQNQQAEVERERRREGKRESTIYIYLLQFCSSHEAEEDYSKIDVLQKFSSGCEVTHQFWWLKLF